MTADDARQMTDESRVELEPKIATVLRFWHTAIEKAARAGRREVRQSEVDRPRGPIPAAAKEAALNRLRSDGFTVQNVETGRNESEVEVSW